MSPTKFVDLADREPSLRRTLKLLDAWVEHHRAVTVLDPRTLGVQLRGISTMELARSLLLLEETGTLRRVYKVLTPSGVYADGEFEDMAQIPERLPDRFAHYFDTSEADIVPVYKWRR